MDRPNSTPSTAASSIPLDGPPLGLFEATPNPYLLLAPDSPAYTIIGVNEAYLRATMTERQAIMGRSIFEVFPDDPGTPEAFSVRDLRASFDRVLQSAQADRMSVHQHNIRRPDGTFEERHWRPLQVPVLGPGNEIVSLIHYAEDVTESVLDARVARSALVASEARFRTITETIEAAFAIVEVKFDVDDRPVDYRFLEANPAFERQAGVDLRGKWVTEFAPNLERFWFETYGRVALTGEPTTFENYAEAFKRWFDVRAVRVGKPEDHQIAIFFSDVTARRQMQARALATLQLSDRLRDVTEPREIGAIAAQVLGETLQASLVGYGRVDAETATISVEQDWSVAEVESLPSLIRSRDYGSHFDDLQRGETVAIADVLLDPRTSAFTDKLMAVGARAFVNVPVFEQGRLVAMLYVGQSEPRTWTDDELIFIRDVTERVRVASERARGEKDLRASEAVARTNIERVQLALAAGAIIGTWHWDLPTDRFTVDDAFARSFGLDPALGREGIPLAQIVATVHPDDQAGLAAAIQEAVARGGAYAHQYRVRRTDGRYYWIEANGRVDHAPDGTPLRFPGVLLDVGERRAADVRRDALLALGERLREADDVPALVQAAAKVMAGALGAVRAGYGFIDATEETVDVSTDWCAPGVITVSGLHSFRTYGSYIDELKRGEVVAVEDVEADPRSRVTADALLAIGVRALVDVPIMERGQLVGIGFVHHSHTHAFTDAEMAFVRTVADRIQTAVARLRAEADQRVLNEEISHRLKNTFAMVLSIAGQTLRTVPDRAPVEAFERRIHALSQAHDVLLRRSWAAAPAKDVVKAVLASAGHGDRIDVSGPEVDLGPRATLSLSLLLHELATNAAKYGALSVPAGRVAIDWRLDGDGADREVILDWTERGGPPATQPASGGRKGFGSRLISMGLAGTGGVDLRYSALGFEATMRAPLVQLQHS
jgi:two-component sensor histidine kinase/PAS domain-containing protein